MRIGILATALSWRVARYRKRIRRAVIRLDGLDLERALGRFGPLPSTVVLVHSSLSATGHIDGGAETVVQILAEWVSGRTLAMPTFSYCYPGKDGTVPAFDVRFTPSVVGAVTDCFWRQPNVLRSLHPTHSLACIGPDSSALCKGHELADTPCGSGTPFQRLIDADCSVLMFGATLASYTLFHTAEDAAKVPYLYEQRPYTLLVKDRDGTQRSVLMQRQDSRVTRRFEAMDDWLEAQGLLRRVRLGCGELLFIQHAAEVHARLVTELHRDPLFLVAKKARPELRTRFGV